MKKLLMLGTSRASCDMVTYAKSHGVYTIVADPHIPENSVAKLISDEHWEIDLADIDKLEEKCKQNGVTAVMCGQSEFALEVCHVVCKRLGIPCYNTPEAWHYSRDKKDFKEICKKTGAPVATDYNVTEALTEEELNSVVFPVMVKPVDRNGNRGVSYCYNKEDLVKAYKYARSLSKSDKIVVERMLHGQQVTSYYAIADGEACLLSLSSMNSEPGMPKNCYSVTTTITNLASKYIKEVNEVVIKTLKAIGITEGICWLELIFDEDQHFYILEMGYRLPGDMIFHPLKSLIGFDSVKWLVDIALGVKHKKSDLPIGQLKEYKKCANVYMLWVKKDSIIKKFEGLEEIERMPGVKLDIWKQEGDHIDIYSSALEFTFTADDCENTIEIIDRINEKVKVIDVENEDIAIHFTDYKHLREMYIY